MRIRPLAALAVATVATGAAFVAGCACTLVGYDEHFRLAISRPAWEPATYRFEGTADGGPFSCEVGRSGASTCNGAVYLDETDGSPTRIPILVFVSNPDVVELHVLRDAEELGAGTFRPEYRHDEPNGPGCGEQVLAELTMTLPGPTPCGIDESCVCVRDDGCGCDRDDVSAAPWSTCPAGTVPRTACEPSRCGCEAPAPFDCGTTCEYDAERSRAICVDGAWTCPDTSPLRSDECV